MAVLYAYETLYISNCKCYPTAFTKMLVYSALYSVKDRTSFASKQTVCLADDQTSAPARCIPAIQQAVKTVQHPALFSRATFPSPTVCLYLLDSSG